MDAKQRMSEQISLFQWTTHRTEAQAPLASKAEAMAQGVS